MLLVQDDDMVQDFAVTRANPALGNSVLPGCLHAGLFWFQPRGLQEGDHISIEFRIAIEDRVPIRTRFWESLTQLLDNPLRGGMPRHVEVQNPAPSMLDDEEAVEQLKGHRRYAEEIEGRDDLAMILQEGQPTSARIPAAAYPAEIPSHGSFRHREPEFLKLSMDLGSAPACILFRHPANERADFVGDFGPAAVRSGSPTPVEPKAGAMPADDSFGLDDEKDAGPARSATAQGGPEQPVERAQYRPRSFPLENSHLLPQGKNFQGGVDATSEEDSDGGQECE
jgi:hypothetical protein